MSFISCPLCGKNSSLNYFDPQSLDLIVYVHDVKGLGRGKGFKIINKRIAFINSSELNKIKLRLLDLVSMFYDNKLITEEEVATKLGLPIKDQYSFKKKHNIMQINFIETEEQLKETEESLKEANSEIDDYSDIFAELVKKIADALEENFDDWDIEYSRKSLSNDENSIITLKHGVEKLINDYLALNASNED